MWPRASTAGKSHVVRCSFSMSPLETTMEVDMVTVSFIKLEYFHLQVALVRGTLDNLCRAVTRDAYTEEAIDVDHANS